MNTHTVKITQVATNKANPRTITDGRFQKLVNSILIFPKMLSIRPIVVDKTMTVLGGNMRFRALTAISAMSAHEIAERMNTIPGYEKRTQGEKETILNGWTAWLDNPICDVISADSLSDEECREFVVKDNTDSGEWDFDALANQFDVAELDAWDVPMPADMFGDMEEPADLDDTEQDEKPYTVKITFQNETDINRFIAKYGGKITEEYNATYIVPNGI